jgi:DNA-binding MarR family transcriptional regulator
MEQVKEAFYKVKQDIEFLKTEIKLLNKDLIETRKSLIEVCEILKEYSNKGLNKEKENPTDTSVNTAVIIQTPAHNSVKSPLNTQNIGISTGNDGVPTDKQTDKPTNQQTDKGSYNTKDSIQQTQGNSSANSIDNALQILESLDNLKKELRLKFKRLTEQEILVFSTLYQSSEEGEGYTDYKNLSEKLKLTESSIRDYVGRLIKKGIPVEKVKINNKTIHLSISPNLKKVASLSTILQLRSL